MAALYFDQYNIQYVENMLKLIAEHEVGELETKLPDIKIKYNASTGKVYPTSTTALEFFDESYSPTLFSTTIAVISDAICLLAKMDLLHGLMTLGDNEVTLIIRNRHIDKQSGQFIYRNPFAMDKTLLDILNYCEPGHLFFSLRLLKPEQTIIQRVIYQVLNHPDYSLHHIDSRDKAKKIIEEMRNQLANVQHKPVTPRSSKP